MLKDVLIIFVKHPEAGYVKTRLAKDIGKEKAAVLYRLFVENILKNTKDATYSRIIFYSPLEKIKEMAGWLGVDIDIRPQEGDNLGERLSNAFRLVFKKGAKRAVAIGTDNPLIDRKIISDALAMLDTKKCVLGPALDGGYYLIGLSFFNPQIFKGIRWSTKKVFGQTIQRLKKNAINYSILSKSLDVDNYRDLLLLKKILPKAYKKNPKGLKALRFWLKTL